MEEDKRRDGQTGLTVMSVMSDKQTQGQTDRQTNTWKNRQNKTLVQKIKDKPIHCNFILDKIN